jgi:ribonuclease HII
MVLAAVALDTRASRALARAGVRDSKAFGAGPASRRVRSDLADLIRTHALWVSLEVCEVPEVDAYVTRGELNHLERERARLLIHRAPACARIIADGRTLFGSLADEFPGFEARDRAESAHVAVAAASICAKSLRDELFASIATKYEPEFGPLRGGGYVNPGTLRFVGEFVKRYGHLPPEARKSWPWQGLA